MCVSVRIGYKQFKDRSTEVRCYVWYLGPYSEAVIIVWVLIILTHTDVIKVALCSMRVLYTHIPALTTRC